ncbi:hypothetical protein [Terricaulis sp.]|uniref:hypothetical protein n=1 Tax=Terricaulis sp. TaxID=2768686 RepID=UPI00378453DA
MSQPSPLARLWTHAQSAITALCASLLPLDTLIAAERRRVRSWLRALETFCRRVALTEALALERASPHVRTRAKSAGAMRAKRRASLRLWPKFKPSNARIRLLGAATSVREIAAAQQRAALAARLAAGRQNRKPAHLRIADRIEALQSFLGAPLRAVRALARKLRQTPGIAHAIVAQTMRPCPFLSQDCVNACDTLSCAALNSS